MPPDSVRVLASACGFTEVALPIASWLCEAVDCSAKRPSTSSPRAHLQCDRHLTSDYGCQNQFYSYEPPATSNNDTARSRDKECDTGHTMAFALCYRSHPERFHDVCTFCLRGWSTVAPSFGLGASSFARLKFSGIEKEKFVMGVTQRTRKLRYLFVTFSRNSALTFSGGAAMCQRYWCHEDWLC